MLDLARWGIDAVPDIVLLGGSSNLSLVSESLARKFGRAKLHRTLSPDCAIAFGATTVARQAEGSFEGDRNITDTFLLQNATSHSLDVECKEDLSCFFANRFT